MRVGVEVGGTFTDLVLVDGSEVRIAKVPSTPASPDIGMLNAIEAAGIDLARVEDLVHGSTVATNAVLERKGAAVALFVTRGTRDILLLQRHTRNSIYDVHYRKPAPIVERNAVFEVEERIASDGTVIEPLDERLVAGLIDRALASADFDAVAICLLNSFVNPDHEGVVARLVREHHPDLVVTCSSDISREFREYERASTTVLASYVQPVIVRYLDRLTETLAANRFAGRFSIMQSNGGRMPADAMARNAIAALFSGPAAGVVGAVHEIVGAGFGNLITLDMGGTSTDVSLVVDGKPQLASMTEIDGLPVKTPVVDIVTVGAGGGSIVWRDDGGLLRVGPKSAGADPGPACYCRGGEFPTVTDAHLIRGTLQADSFLGGTMAIDRTASERAFSGLAVDLGMSIEELADSAIRVAESNIVRAIQQISTERGHDPRDYVVVPYGGAGPLHAARVAEELGIVTVVVPPNAGVLSAAGLLRSDYLHHRARTRRLRLDDDAIGEIKAMMADLEREIGAYFDEIGIGETRNFERVLEMRYVGQAYEVSVPVSGADLDTLDVARLTSMFAEQHHSIFEFSKPPENPVEIVSVRVGARTPSPPMPEVVATTVSDMPEPREISLLDRGVRRSCMVLARSQLAEGPRRGPLLIEDGNSTIYVAAGWRAALDPHGNVILHAEES